MPKGTSSISPCACPSAGGVPARAGSQRGLSPGAGTCHGAGSPTVFLFGTKLEGIQLQESTSFHRIVFLIYNCTVKLGLFRVDESLNLAFYLIHHMTIRIQAFIWGTARVFFSCLW
jgi:hypothetical protein